MTVVYKNVEYDQKLWQKIEQANKSIATIDIKGKDYAQVNQRIKAFRYVFTRGKIETKIISLEGELGHRQCLMRCEVYDDLGNLLSVGYAEEKEDSTFINKTSFIENCETSAVGRALGMAGFGIDTSIASAEEVETAMANQSKKPTILKISQFVAAYSEEERAKIREHYKVENDEDLPREVVDKYVADRKDKVKEAQAEVKKQYETKPNLDSKENPFY